jgi:hypothetical protein
VGGLKKYSYLMALAWTWTMRFCSLINQGQNTVTFCFRLLALLAGQEMATATAALASKPV